MLRSPWYRVGQFVRHEKGKDWLAIALLAGLALLFFWRIVFLGQVLLPADMIYTAEPWKSEAEPKLEGIPWNPVITDAIWQFLPTADYAQEARQNGALFWDPYPMAGMPALARGDMFSNPVFALLSTFLTVAQAISWMAVFHVFIASLFTFLLLREMGTGRLAAMIGGVAFAYNGYLVGWVSIPNNTNTMVWLPVVFWGIECALQRKNWHWVLAAALGFALQILSGFLIWPFYGALTLVIFSIYRSIIAWSETKELRSAIHPVLYAGLALGIGALLVAPQLLLTAQLYFQTTRTEALGAASFLDIKSHLIRLFSPTIYGNSLHGEDFKGLFNYSETNIYFGVLALFFIFASLFSPRRKLAWGLFGVGLVALLAVYNLFPFRQIVELIYPVFLRAFPGRIFYIVAFTWSVAAGLGADWLFSERPKRQLGWQAIASAILSIGFLALILLQQALRKAEKTDQLSNVANMLVKSEAQSLLVSITLLVGVAFLFWVYYKRLIRPGWFAGLALVVMIADLFWAGIDYNPTFDSRWVFPDVPSLAFLEELKSREDEPYRVLNVNSGLILLGGTPQLYRLPTISGYSSWVLERFSEYANLTQSRGKTPPVYVYFTDCCHPLINALNVKYVYVSKRVQPTSSGIFDLVTRLDQARKESTVEDAIYITKWLQNDGVKIPALFEHPPARLDYNVFLSASAILTGLIALDPQAWKERNDGVQFEVYASPAGGSQELLFSRVIDPKHNPAERQPVPFQVDLSRYVGKEIVLSLVTTPGANGDNQNDWAMWIQPQIQGYKDSSLELVYNGENKVYENKEALPRAWIVHQAIAVPPNDLAAVKERLSRADFDPATQAVVEIRQLPGNLQRAETVASQDQTKVVAYTPEHISLQTSLEQPGLLVLSDVMYPGWKAYVDGVEQPILLTNLIMRGVFLESGEHTVEFVFRPDLFYIGAMMSAATILVILFVLWIERLRRVKSKM